MCVYATRLHGRTHTCHVLLKLTVSAGRRGNSHKSWAMNSPPRKQKFLIVQDRMAAPSTCCLSSSTRVLSELTSRDGSDGGCHKSRGCQAVQDAVHRVQAGQLAWELQVPRAENRASSQAPQQSPLGRASGCGNEVSACCSCNLYDTGT